MMALRSNIHMENLWALNALTVMLYDDSMGPPTLSPELLNISVEHFRAALSLVFPKVFPLEPIENFETSFIKESTPEDIWGNVVEDAKKIGEPLKQKVKLPPGMKNSLGRDLNTVSRMGLKIVTKDAEMPVMLKKWKVQMEKDSGTKRVETKAPLSYKERRQLGLSTELAVKVAECTKNYVEQMSAKSDKVVFSKWLNCKVVHYEYDDDVQPKEQRNFEDNVSINFLFRSFYIFLTFFRQHQMNISIVKLHLIVR